jgi:mannan endo-1,4-beta-mannosidase
MSVRKPWWSAVVLAATAVGLTGCSVLGLGHSSAPPKSTAHGAASSGVCSAQVKIASRYLGFASSGISSTIDQASAFSSLVGQRPNLIAYYISFGDPFDASLTCDIAKEGALPVVQIDPDSTSVAKIADGFYDNYLSAYAEAVKEFHATVVISFGHEMNGVWYSWGPNHLAPSVFVAAWQQIHQVFGAVGATNVIWLWCPNILYSQSPPIDQYYPGNNYVDWIGIDGYFRYSGQTFESVFGPTLQQVAAITTNKPIVISETGVASDVQHPAIEVDSLFSGVESTKNVLGFVWFNSVGSLDWRLQDDPAGLAAFQADVRDGW